MVKVESKEKLAKLLAMEDIDVEHRQVKTAMFDVKSRCLVLPTWKDMPNHLYDLLVGHEVGHALYTPADEETLKSIIQKTSKHCVNVVEDARIESLMKRRYPGLIKQFYNGYSHLVNEDFFGLSKMDTSRINLLDKINLHFKIPTAVSGLFEFNDIEQSFVDRIENITKFKEVEKLCIEICEYIKENREEQEDDNSIFDEDSYTMTDENNEDGETSDTETEDSEEEAKTEDSEKGEDSEEDSEDGETSEEDVEENGTCMEVVPGTHKIFNLGVNWSKSVVNDLNKKSIKCVGKKGTIHIHSGNVIHRLNPVKGSQRLALHLEFSPGSNILLDSFKTLS